MRTAVLALIVLCSTQIVFAQITDNSSIYLKNSKIKTERNISSYADNQTIEKVYNNKYFKVVHFDKIPLQSEKERMQALGMEFLDYIPNNAFIIAFPENFDKTLLTSYNIKAVIDLSNDMKQDYYLLNEDYPEWALVGKGQILITIQLHKNVNSELAVSLLSKYNFYINSRQDNGKVIHALVNIDQLKAIIAEPFVKYAEVIAPPPVAEDTPGRSIHRANTLDADYGAGRNYTGKGIRIAINDDGFVGPHVDFKGRTDQTDVAGDLTGDHGDMVAGIAGGAGNIDPTVRGMATEVFLYIRQYVSSLPNTEALHLSDTIILFSSSYSNGCNAGYTTTTELVDREIHDNPTLIQTFSAGNSGTSNCGYGAGNVWGNITGGHKIGKNVIATGNMDRLGNLQTSSSRGPASDGRIKPDICAHGASQLSTDPVNSYAPGGGTSAAAPGIAGITAQLYQAYRELNGGAFPESPLIKACLLNNAKDRGNPGPDFQYGWGRVNALRAVETIEDNRFLSSTVTQGANNNHTISVPAGTKELRVMLYWLDPEGSTIASKALVNDLNMQLTEPGGATTYNPWVLDPTPNAVTLDLDAVRGIDTLNNVEQVTLDNPPTGSYIINVNGVSVPQGPQKYYIVYTFINDSVKVTYPLGGESLVAGEAELIRWDAYGDVGTFTIEFSSNNGGSWSTITTGIAASSRQYSWTVTNVETAQGLIRVSRTGSPAIQSEAPFNIYPVPANLVVSGVCPTYTRLDWDPVVGAVSYDIFELGNKFMEIIGNTSNTIFDIPTNPANEDWYSVRANGPNGEVGRRAYAVQKVPGILNCPVNRDVSIAQIISPGEGTLNNCIDLTNIQILVDVKNPGLQPQSNFPVSYRLDNTTTFTETFTDTLLPGASSVYTFSTSIDLSSSGTHIFEAWTSLVNDSATFNDTSVIQINVIAGSTFALPYSQNFELFSLCGTTTDCEGGTCVLAGGWLNEQNLDSDDIDWRTDENGTPSVGTGPTIDHNPGTSTGNYLYLEASGTCDQKEAVMISPCISIGAASAPTLSYWYHMFGTNIGSLHLDIFDGSTWTIDAHPAIIGNQGDIWNETNLSLAPYIGKTINLRFRGVTGVGFESDIAVDDIEIVDLNSPPISAFTSDLQILCPGETAAFIDQTSGAAATWAWSVNPNTVIFVNGTTPNSQNPQVQFSNTGTYDVTLITTNGNGSDTLTQINYITVVSGTALPVSEDFESFALCSSSADCGLTSCTLGNGWTNLENGIADNIDWRVFEGPTGSVGTGPSFDLNPGTATGNYIYLEASGTCDNQTAILESSCIDLSTATAPTITFGYHMYGGGVGSLHVDLFNGSNWISDIIPAISGNQGDVWNNGFIDISAYAGSTVKIRFRGVTGLGFESDIALDDINVIDFILAPVAQFSSDANTICSGESVTFKDESQNFPTSRLWNISPPTITYLYGTGPTSAQPIIQFNANGTYDVSLVASNANGSDTLSQTSFISVGNGLSLPFNEDFESFPLCSETANCGTQICQTNNGWTNDINGIDDDIDWRPDANGTSSLNTGPTVDHKPGTTTGIYLYTETSGSCVAQTGQLVSPCLDLSTGSFPFMTFWYHMYGLDMGTLHVDVFDGSFWINDIMTPISGDQGNSWKKATVSLVAYNNPGSKIRFRTVTGASFTSDMAIDNVSVFDSILPPCGTPTNISTTINTVNSATLNWGAVLNASQYKIRGKAVQSNSYINITVNGNQNWYVATGLNPTYYHHWQVSAVCNEVNSGFSEFDTFTTNMPISCVIPSPISTSNITSNSAILNWTSVANAVKYEIQGREVGTATIVKLIRNAPNTSYLATGLKSQTSYEWRVRALCDQTGAIKSDFTTVTVFTTNAASEFRIDPNVSSLVYPNPFSDRAILKFDNMDQGNYHLVISDVDGRIIKEISEINGQQIELNAAELGSGVYFYQLIGSSNYSGKFIIQK
ncbi:MAG: S8 family serine peptidase [Chitinophagales bacterium]|nr:S8 family serine peptidase [Chitinophagales bacterium]